MYLQGVANPADPAFHLPGHRLANHMGHNCHVLRFPTNAILILKHLSSAFGKDDNSILPGGMTPTNEWGWTYMQV